MKTITFNYTYTDKALKALRREMILSFNRMKSRLTLASFDELNVLSTVNEEFDDLYGLIIKCGAFIVKHYMNAMGIEDKDWTSYVTKMLNRYNGVTQYKFSSEYERKKYRLVESIVSLGGLAGLSTSMRLMDRQIQQFGIDLTDYVNIQAAIELGYTTAQWISQTDSKVCRECEYLDRKIFPINEIPDKPHINCRCTLKFIQGAKSLNI